ncbi:DUF4179 domain-containing protein [Paenibacillus sp. DMB20]|uniref:DUF4179 domain-containing protein n=1 Tax=Paenibacillus sp. DMB20 TaxID=1642570 RepID=UPI0006274BD2|nr:DUF4179 domain-containing protein [Paenibacillus sp. DMB20]KKO50782.1 hypothetical protein XI25_30160 [Paenibacillus sp. DMB20]
MHEKEERMLRSFTEDAKSKAAAVSDEAFESAIREGIRQGRRRKRRLRLRDRGLVLFAGALAAVLLLMWNIVLHQPERMAAGPFPLLKGHELGEDITLNTANKHGLIQPVGKSVTKGDYTITVDGVLVGSQQLNVFYTLENRSDRIAIVQGEELKDPETGKSLKYGSRSGGAFEFDKGTHEVQVDFTFSENDAIPEDITLAVRMARDSANARAGIREDGGEELNVGFRLDMDTYRKYIHTIPLNQAIDVEGQKIMLREAVVSPTGIVLKANIDKENTMKVFGLHEPYLESVKNGEIVRLVNHMSWLPDESGNMTYFFGSNALDRPDSITLRSEGLHAVDPSLLKVKVDTETGAVLHSPDEMLKFDEYVKGKEVHTLKLEYENRNSSNSSNLSFEPEFVDGKGKRHTESDAHNGTRTETRSGSETGWSKATYYFYLKPRDYSQPLTFTLTSYPGLIEKAIEIPIK